MVDTVVVPAPATNTRFAVIWALLFPVITAAVYLVPALDVAHWTDGADGQTALVIGLANAVSALILAIVAYNWHDTTQEPVAIQNSLGAVIVATFAVGNAFTWWQLSARQQNLIYTFMALLLVAAIGVTRQFTYSKKGVVHVVTSAHAQGMGAASRKLTDGSDLPGAPGPTPSERYPKSAAVLADKVEPPPA